MMTLEIRNRQTGSVLVLVAVKYQKIIPLFVNLLMFILNNLTVALNILPCLAEFFPSWLCLAMRYLAQCKF